MIFIGLICTITVCTTIVKVNVKADENLSSIIIDNKIYKDILENTFNKDLSVNEKKLSTKMLSLTQNQNVMNINEITNTVNNMQELNQADDTFKINDSISEMQVYVYISIYESGSFSSVEPYIAKMISIDDNYGLAAAWVKVDNLLRIAKLSDVRHIEEVFPPFTNTGSHNSEGDAIHGADNVRNTFGAHGEGVKVGVISDGVDSMNTAVASGDLPSNVTVLRNDQGGEEGTAMMEIVYDLAPEAKLYFHDCGSNVIEFNNAIDALVSAGCDIICDDIGWLTEPFFEDGIIAEHITNLLLTNDIVYTTSAGNSATRHYQGQYNDNGNGFHDFSEGTSDYKSLYMQIPNGSEFLGILQWNDLFGESSNDYDLILVNNATGDILERSEITQDGTGDPIEYVYYKNETGAEIIAEVFILKYNALGSEMLEMFLYNRNTSTVIFQDNLNSIDSIFGHAAVPNVITCGAVHPNNPNDIAYYSSLGPVTMITEARPKPDICGLAGVEVTGSGGFPSPFYGTSAAAPHIAAIVAILESRFPDYSPNEIKQLLFNNSVDLGDSQFDNIYGWGRADAMKSASSILYVHYNSMGGTQINSQLVSNGSGLQEPADPSRDECEFAGWYKDSGCSLSWDFANDTVTVDTTLHAGWNTKYDVNSDLIVNDLDVMECAKKYLTNDAKYDFDSNGVVNLFDLVKISTNLTSY